MASIVSAFSTPRSIRLPNVIVTSCSTSSVFFPVRTPQQGSATGMLKLRAKSSEYIARRLVVRAVEEETVTQEALGDEEVASSAEPSVSVPVSASDLLTMFFQAEGTMSEMAIPAVTKALEGTDGVTNLKVRVHEGIASVELTKQTTVQATGVASGLVETIQGSGFKLQTLNLSFEDGEDTVN